MNKAHVKTHEKDREEKKFSKLLPNNQIITACCIELRVQEITMNEKVTMIGLTIFQMSATFDRKGERSFEGGAH